VEKETKKKGKTPDHSKKPLPIELDTQLRGGKGNGTELEGQKG